MHPGNAALSGRNLFKWIERIRLSADYKRYAADRESARHALKEVPSGNPLATALLWKGPDHCFPTMIVRREGINLMRTVLIRSVRALRLSGLLLWPSFAFLRHLPVNGKLFFCILLAPRPSQSRCKTVVCARISGLQLDRHFEWWNRLGESLGREQRCAEPQKRISKAGIQFCGAREMFEGIGPL